MIKKLIPLSLIGGLVGLFLGGCATGRGTLNVQVDVPVNPAQGKVVRISEVKDSRVFEIKPKKPSIPSLMNDDDYSNADIKARAIARKRGGYGNALGDIVLPEGFTVRMLVNKIITRAFREAGYSVVDNDSVPVENAIPVTIDIKQFWGWLNPGFTSATVEFIAELDVKGNIPGFEKGKAIAGKGKESSMAASTKTWNAAMNYLIDDIIRNAKK